MINGNRYFRYLVPHMRRIAFSFLVLFGIQICQLLRPWPLKIAIDDILGNGSGPGIWGGMSMNAKLLLVCIALVLIYFILGGLVLLSNYATIRISNKVMNDFRGDLYSHIQRLSLSFHSRRHTGDILYRLTADTAAMQVVIIKGIFPLLSAFLLLGGIVVVMLHIDWGLSLVTAGICPILLVSIAVLNRKITEAAIQVREKESQLFTLVNSSLSALRVVQTFAREASEFAKFMKASRDSLNAGLHLNVVETVHAWVVNTLIAVGTALVVWFGVKHAVSGRLTVGDLVVFISYVTTLYGPINSITQSWGLLHEAKAGLDRVFEILNLKNDLPDGHASFPAQGATGEIIFAGVGFGYDGNQPVLQDIDLHIKAGEKVAVVGASGAGKSTLMSLIPRFADAASGRVLVDGRDVRDYKLDSLRRQIGMVLQIPIVFPASVRDNIAYGRPDATDAEIAAAARIACIDGLVESLPEKYGTLIGEGGQSLSEGEKQRLTIARAVLLDTPILLLDEPTSSLDAETEKRIMESLLRGMEGKTVVVITHRISAVEYADRTIVLDQGKILGA